MFPGMIFALFHHWMFLLTNQVCQREGVNMEKIVVLTGSSGDDNLINCLKMLFPECVVEVHERRPIKDFKNKDWIKQMGISKFSKPSALPLK